MGMIARLRNLIEGAFGQWMKGREHRHPGAVYEAAIQARVEQYARLREAAAGVIYMRGKLGKELSEKSAALAEIGRELDFAVAHDDDALSLVLITRRQHLQAEVDHLQAEVAEVTAEAETAKANLVRFQDEIVHLKEEKVRMLAKWANARAKRHLQKTLDGLTATADIRALEEVREYIQRLSGELEVQLELSEGAAAKRLAQARRSQADAAAQAELAERKRLRHAPLVPVSLASAVV